ncbi:unnamed protein product [Heligmosomoides polygyrus]|uniref:Phlebovirus_G2 domain-containing protein n=1 Tax=Heligmosomoides polygyrus TaxID=6339 RepID=A0A183GST2_HELPZ|nr:unnamed protein product [Heligmosomoides polygyrus]
MGCYAFLYIPFVIGRPLRVIGSLLWKLLLWPLRKIFGRTSIRHQPSRRPRDLLELLAVTTAISSLSILGQSCQQVDLFTHSSTICYRDGLGEVCHVQVSEVLKINPFKRNACFRLVHNQSAVHELRLTWKSLSLECEQETVLFTRDTFYNVIDSKRCPHSGSCTGEKCAAINSSSLLSELAEGNKYPGRTACVESCGGPGCDCFFLSSGCLFYRIYLKPRSSRIFRIFRCPRWAEAVKLRIAHLDSSRKKSSSVTTELKPNVPVKWNNFTFTLSVLTVPPTPLLQTSFISDGKKTAVWGNQVSPPLQCNSTFTAETMDCLVADDCKCYPAETKANCRCRAIEILPWFNNPRNQLPVVTPSLTFVEMRDGGIRAIIPSMVTSEVVMTLQDNLRMEIIADNDRCTATAGSLSGCYNCVKGAQVQVKCTSTRTTQAEVVCESGSFTKPCDEAGVETTLHFALKEARIHQVCSISCGQVRNSFDIVGILKYPHTASEAIERWIKGESVIFSDIKWPDFSHIAQVFLQWYKTLIATIVILVLCIGVTYLMVISTVPRIVFWLVFQAIKFFRCLLRMFFRFIRWLFAQLCCLRTRRHSKHL